MYPLDILKTFTPTINIPQAEDVIMKEAYKFTVDNWQTTGWSIQCSLKQNLVSGTTL